MLQRIKHIWNRSLTHRSEVSCIYICQLIFGCILGYLSYSTINHHIGQSMALDHLASGFDRTVFMDIIYNNDDVFTQLSIGAMILIPFYFILSILLQGGFLNNIKKGNVGIKFQLKNGINNLLPFLGFTIISSIFIFLFAVLIGLPFKILVGDPLVTFSSEKPFVISLGLLIILFSVFIITVWGFNISARYSYIEGSSFWKSIQNGVSFVINHFLKILLIGYLLVGIHILLSITSYLIMRNQGAHVWISVILIIGIQQLFSFIRVYIRSLGYIAIDQLDDKFIG